MPSSSSGNTPLPPVEPSRLMPKISVRSIMVLTVVAAVLSSVARAAGGGAALARGIISSIVFIAVVMVILAIIFSVAWIAARVWYAPDDEIDPSSPFASDQLPPQILPPKNPLS